MPKPRASQEPVAFVPQDLPGGRGAWGAWLPVAFSREVVAGTGEVVCWLPVWVAGSKGSQKENPNRFGVSPVFVLVWFVLHD